jgi:membrane protein implicated in regulation of membrane protease activity
MSPLVLSTIANNSLCASGTLNFRHRVVEVLAEGDGRCRSEGHLWPNRAIPKLEVGSESSDCEVLTGEMDGMID